jgi:hypothetical protein
MVAWYEKLGIGAVGGFSLSLLKLTDAGFYLKEPDHSVAVGAYLTYAVYLILGMIVGFFFCEDVSDAQKTRKNAFLMGLLAPSVLIAIVTKPVDGATLPSASLSSVKSLTRAIEQWASPSLLAEGQAKAQAAAASVPVETVEKQSGFASGVLSALGRDASNGYVYVLGKTDNENVARQKALEVNTVLQQHGADSNVKARILKPSADGQYYLAIGADSSGAAVMNVKKTANETASKAMVDPAARKDAIQLLLQGQVVSKAALAK